MNFETIKIESNTFKMISANDLIVNALTNGQSWEQFSLKIWTDKVKATTGNILDIGAYTGIYSLLAASIDGDRNVIAFEPLPRVFDRLLKNVVINAFENIGSVNYALSNEESETNIFVTNPIPLPSGSSLSPTSEKTISEKIKITAIIGDEYIKSDMTNIDKIGLIKIDAEHHEVEVLEGLHDTLVKDRPVCLIEILHIEKLVNIFRTFNDTLQYGHIYHINDNNGTLTEITNDNISESPELMNTGMNFLFEPL